MFNIKYECKWDIQHIRNGKVIWEIINKKNMLCDEGEKAIIDTFFRSNAALYFGATNFYVGVYNGSIGETTVLATIPNEPAVLYGYARQVIERSAVGWPTIEKDDGDWRVVSKTLTLTATGGSIGPINGAFFGTSSDNNGTLIGSLQFGVERTILTGDSITMALKAKLK